VPVSLSHGLSNRLQVAKTNIQGTQGPFQRNPTSTAGLQHGSPCTQVVNPPCPKLTWAQIVEYTTIAEFELLCMGAQEDIHNLEWANARNHEATICHLKLLCAQKEITRLNVEIKRLATWLVDEPLKLDSAIKLCTQNDPLLAAAISDFPQERKCINRNLQVTLGHIYTLQGFSGDSRFGQKVSETMVPESGGSGEVGWGWNA